MARKLVLRDVQMLNPLNEGQVQTFSYSELLLAILRLSPPGRGMSYDEVEAAMLAAAPIKEARDSGADQVTLTEEQYRTLIDKLNQFQFSVATDEIVEFGRMIKSAPEIGTEPAVLKRA